MTTSPYQCCDCFQQSATLQENALDSRWIRVSGTWSGRRPIPGAPYLTIREAGTAGAQLVWSCPAGDPSFVVDSGAYFPASGAKHRLLLNYKDSDNYHFAEFHFLSNQLTISLGKYVNGQFSGNLGSKTWTANLIGMQVVLRACFSDKLFWACAKDWFATWVENPAPIADGLRAGLSNGSNIALDFGGFSVSEHWATNVRCPRCGCWCFENPVSEHLQAEYTITGDMSVCTPNPFTVDLDWCNAENQWEGLTTIDCSACPTPDGTIIPCTMTIQMGCGFGSSTPSFRARVFHCCRGWSPWLNPTEIYCQPFRLVFEEACWYPPCCDPASYQQGCRQLVITER